MKLESRENIKIYLEITNPNHDSLLDLIIDQVSARIEKFLNRKLTKQEYTEYFDVKISKKFFHLRSYPIDLAEDFTASQYDVEDTINSDYFVYEDSGIVEYFTDRIHCNEPKCIKFVYTAGYEEIYTEGEDVLNVPDDLKRACLLQSVFEFRRRRDIGLTSISTPDGSISKSITGTLLTEVSDILKSYRNKASTRH